MTTNETGTIAGSQIVGTQSGRGTGDTIYTTADGRRWESCSSMYPPVCGTGQMIEQIKR